MKRGQLSPLDYFLVILVCVVGYLQVQYASSKLVEYYIYLTVTNTIPIEAATDSIYQNAYFTPFKTIEDIPKYYGREYRIYINLISFEKKYGIHVRKPIFYHYWSGLKTCERVFGISLVEMKNMIEKYYGTKIIKIFLEGAPTPSKFNINKQCVKIPALVAPNVCYEIVCVEFT